MNQSTPDISVIIAAHNVERYIGRAIESALSQEGVALEIIVADDASTDGTRTIISKYTDPRIRTVFLETNGGPGAARNAAIRMATGAWIAILDGDDLFLPDRFQRCLKPAAAQNTDIVVDNLLIHRESDHAEFPMFSPEPFARLKQLDLTALIRGTFPNAGNYTLGYLKPVFSSSFLRRHHLAYNPELKIGEDYLLLAEALANGAKCIVEPSAGYRYTVRKDSISYRLSLENLTRMMQADARFVSRYPLAPEAAEAQRIRAHIMKKEYGYILLVDAIKQKKAQALLKAAAMYPSSLWLLHRPLGVRVKRLLNAAKPSPSGRGLGEGLPSCISLTGFLKPGFASLTKSASPEGKGNQKSTSLKTGGRK